MIKNFIFNDIVLYSKGWYKRSDNILDDLGYLFSKIYAFEPKTENEVALFMMKAIDRLYNELDIKFDPEHSGRFNNSFSSFTSEISHRMLMFGISHDMAIIYWAMNIFFSLTNDEIELEKPHFGKKEHFRLGMLLGEYPISQTYTEMNKYVDKVFDSIKNKTK